MAEEVVDLQLEAIARGVDEFFTGDDRMPRLKVYNGFFDKRPFIDVHSAFTVFRGDDGFLTLHPMTSDDDDLVSEESDPDIDADRLDAFWESIKPTFAGIWPQMTTADWIGIVAVLWAWVCDHDPDRELYRSVLRRAIASVPADSVLNKFHPG